MSAIIKNIIFDLGGVFINLDFKKTERAFTELGVADFSTLFTQHYVSPLFEELELGTISPRQFYEGFRSLTKLPLTDDQVKDAWNAILLDFPINRLQWLSQIKNKYKIFLFSNTNQIHYDCFIDILKRATGKGDFSQYFIKAYYSHEMGMRKPHKESYLQILEEQKLVAAETLFIDDTLKNIEGARQAGLQTIHLVPPQTVLDLNL